MNFLKYLQKDKVLLEVTARENDLGYGEPFDRNNHVMIPTNSTISYDGKQHAIYRKAEEDGSRIFGIRNNNMFIPFKKESPLSGIYGDDHDKGHTSTEQGIRHMIDMVDDNKSFKELKKILSNTFSKVTSMDDDEKRSLANTVINHPKITIKRLKPQEWKKENKGNVKTSQVPTLTIVDKQGNELHLSSGGREREYETIIKPIERLTGKKFKEKETVRKDHLFSPEHRWHESDNSDKLTELKGRHVNNKKDVSEFFGEISNYYDDKKITKELENIKNMLSSTKHTGFVGIEPKVYFDNPEGYKKNMLHLLSFIVNDTAEVTFNQNKDYIKSGEIERVKKYINSLADHIDNGQLNETLLGKTFYAMSKQFKHITHGKRIERSFTNNMSKIFASATEVMDGKYVMLPTSKKSILGNKIQLLSRSGKNGRVLKKPIVVVGINRLVKVKGDDDSLVGGMNSAKGLLHTSDFGANLSRKNVLSSVNSIKYFLGSLHQNEGLKDFMIQKGLQQNISNDVISVISNNNPLLKKMINEYIKNREFSDDVLDDLPFGDKTQGTAKDYMIDHVIENIGTNKYDLIRVILKHTGIGTERFKNEINNLKRNFPNEESINRFKKMMINRYKSQKNTSASINRVLDIILKTDFRNDDIEKIVQMHPEDLELLTILSSISHKTGENTVYHQIIPDKNSQQWHSHDNYGLRDPEKQGYLNKHNGSSIAGFLNDYKLKSPSDNPDILNKPDKFYHVGKYDVNKTKENRENMNSIMNQR